MHASAARVCGRTSRISAGSCGGRPRTARAQPARARPRTRAVRWPALGGDETARESPPQRRIEASRRTVGPRIAGRRSASRTARCHHRHARRPRVKGARRTAGSRSGSRPAQSGRRRRGRRHARVRGSASLSPTKGTTGSAPGRHRRLIQRPKRSRSSGGARKRRWTRGWPRTSWPCQWRDSRRSMRRRRATRTWAAPQKWRATRPPGPACSRRGLQRRCSRRRSYRRRWPWPGYYTRSCATRGK